jgi:BioD-like phosphotransacetylase family protein
MAAVKLNLLIEQDVVEKMKEYVAQHRTSISRVVENIFLAITSNEKSDKMEISPFVKSLSIDNVKLPDDFDYKREMSKAMEEKYL